MYLFDYERRSEVLLHSHSSHSKVKQSLLIDRWPIVLENLINLTFSWGEMTLSWGEMTFSWSKTTWGEMTIIQINM